MAALVGVSIVMSLVFVSLRGLISARTRQQYGVWVPLGGLVLGLSAIGYMVFFIFKGFVE